MPAGTTWSVYLKFTTAAMFTMFLGSQTVHLFYRPLDDLEEYVKRLKEQHQLNIEQNSHDLSNIKDNKIKEDVS